MRFAQGLKSFCLCRSISGCPFHFGLDSEPDFKGIPSVTLPDATTVFGMKPAEYKSGGETCFVEY